MGKIKEHGQSLVELAIGITILIYLLSGAVEFGLIFFQYVQLRDAAQEGALFAAIEKTKDPLEIEERARGASDTPLDLHDPGVSVDIIVSDGNKNIYTACEGDAVEVRVNYAHKVFMPFMPLFIGDYIRLSGVVVDTVLTPICPMIAQ